jgi:hypothetical protein
MLFDSEGFIGYVEMSTSGNTYLWDGGCWKVTYPVAQLIRLGYMVVCPD